MALGEACFPVTWPDSEEETPVEVKLRAERMAGRALHMLTGYQVGGCPITVRPCAPGCVGGTWLTAPVTGALPWVPYISNGQWTNACGCRRSDCACSTVNEILLPGPIGEVISIDIGGLILPEPDYRVDNGNSIVRMDGGTWPACQDMNAESGELDTFSITYLRGVPVDEDGVYMAGLLAAEYANALQNKKCRLPKSVTSITRQGVTMEFGEGVFPFGLTNIPEVDAWVEFWNPYKLKAPSGVYSIDVPRPRQTTWVATSGS